MSEIETFFFIYERYIYSFIFIYSFIYSRIYNIFIYIHFALNYVEYK